MISLSICLKKNLGMQCENFLTYSPFIVCKFGKNMPVSGRRKNAQEQMPLRRSSEYFERGLPGGIFRGRRQILFMCLRETSRMGALCVSAPEEM